MQSGNMTSIGGGGGSRSGSLLLGKQLRNVAFMLLVVVGYIGREYILGNEEMRRPLEGSHSVVSEPMSSIRSPKHAAVPLVDAEVMEQKGVLLMEQDKRTLKYSKIVPAATTTTKKPTTAPTAAPFQLPVDDTTGVTTFYVMGDIPYGSTTQLNYLRDQVKNLPSSAEFFVHVGDIKSGSDTNCVLKYYTDVSSALLQSRVPVFIVPGDNEWNDCSKPNDAWKNWVSQFMFFENKWTHNFQVTRMPGRNETFAFIRKGTLFMGFNIVGGKVHNSTEWSIRLSTQAQWAIKMVRYYDTVTDIGRIVMFAHADPTSSHAKFYDPFKSFVVNELKNRLPILVINGDGHAWKYQPTFFGSATSMLRVMVTAKATRPAHKMVVNATGSSITSFSQAFTCVY